MVTVLGTLLLSSCNKKGTDSRKEITKASRIVALSPSGAEILSTINAENLIVARTDFCDYPESLKSIPSIGGFSGDTLSVESILKYNPDFVYGAAGIHDSIKENLERLNIDVYLSESSSIEDILNEIEFMGTVTNHKEESESVTQKLRAQIENLKEKASVSQSVPQIYWEVWNAPYMTAANKSFINDVMELSGGKNIFADVNDVYPIISEEIIIKRNPDVIIIPQENGITVETLKKRPGWENIKAVKNENVIFIDSDLYTRPGPRIINAAEELFEKLHK
ncbi:ABC transporter substrate-binding protein [Treponema sp.]|uniref:ABC transporter substrate-binding protein n=1 Tax=Treponema sp. TaxID=166 RepID=UPI0025F89ED3|nr:helical backbone metal receptor [Treponema sp.]MCR5219248.1 helical backbone metal receptor [Treponema sp.]